MVATLRVPGEEVVRHRLKGKHILSAGQFSRADVEDVMRVAELMVKVDEHHPWCELLRGRILASIFFEPSTRTYCSFLSAHQRLGGGVLPILGVEFSSVAKGETFRDTMRAFEAMSHALVIRHKEDGSAARAAEVLKKPLINGGDGKKEHPTQALLDLFTMLHEHRSHRIDGLTVTMVGDLAKGRTVHSLAKLLQQFNVRMNFVSRADKRLPEEIVSDLSAGNCAFACTDSLEDVLPETDVLYMTRTQMERMSDEELAVPSEPYCVSSETMKRAKPDMVLMHPLPRGSEINEEVDADPRAAYFRQIENGVYVRMALLAMVLGAV